MRKMLSTILNWIGFVCSCLSVVFFVLAIYFTQRGRDD